MNYYTRSLRIFTNIFLKASSVAGLITTIGKEAGKEEFKQAFNKTNNLYLATLLERVIIANRFIVWYYKDYKTWSQLINFSFD